MLKRNRRAVITVTAGILILIFVVCVLVHTVADRRALRLVSETLGIVDSFNLPDKDNGKDSDLILVNKDNPIPEDYKVHPVGIERGYSIDKRAREGLKDMLRDCREAGCEPVICSAYRSHEDQERLFEQETQGFIDQGLDEDEAREKASEATAIPGTSEHECGLAVDIIDASYQLLDKMQEETDTQKWLMTHCQDYGFILRYPNHKKAITGIIYEPWHYRYVGRDNAKAIMDSGLCLEEFLAAEPE